MNMSERLRAVIKLLNISNGTLARESGVSRQVLHNFMKGNEISLKNFEKIAEAINLKIIFRLH